MKHKSWLTKTFSSGVLTGMAALCLLSYGNVAYAANPEMNI